MKYNQNETYKRTMERIEALIKAGTPEKDARGRKPKDPREVLRGTT
jgi:hypothetical protein